MRFERLEVPAFGPFTNLSLEFPDPSTDFHVIFGVNEAGKSSLLRAIRDLLFGIHAQSSDNFIHGYADLRIKAEIRSAAGDRLIFQRRKGSKNTLLDGEGRQLPEHALAPFIGSVDSSYFSAMFGLGSRELHEGAKQLLRGEGDLGSALFSASLGGTPIQKVIETLQGEAGRIFKGRATSSVSLRPAVHRYKELLKQTRDSSVSPESWIQIETDMAEATEAKSSLEEDISKLDRDLQWLSRCEDALPAVGRLAEATRRLGQLPSLPELAGDFLERARAARAAVRETSAEVERLTAQTDKLRAQLRNCRTAPALLAEAESLDELHQGLGAWRDRQQASLDLKASLAGLEDLIRSRMRTEEITGGFESLDRHRVSNPKRLACEEAAGTLRNVLLDQAANTAKVDELEQLIRDRESQLDSFPDLDLTVLRDSLTVAAEATVADRTLAASESEVARLALETTSLHAQVPGAPADFAATAGLAVPGMATIRRFQGQWDRILQDIAQQRGKIEELAAKQGAIQGELSRLGRQGQLPSEEALQEARRHRDHGWSLVLARWKRGVVSEELTEGLPLEEAFPRAIATADHIADQLRLQAEAVAQVVEKKFQLSELAKQTTDSERRIRELEQAMAECQISWRAEWAACGIEPRSPLEMEEWRGCWNAFKESLFRLKTAEASLLGKRQQLQEARHRLAMALSQPEQREFSSLFAEAKSLIQAREQSSGRRLQIVSQVEELKADLTKLGQHRVRLAGVVKESHERWESQCLAAGLPEGTSPEVGVALLRERRDLIAKFDSWRELSNQYQSTAESMERYQQAVREKTTALGFAVGTTENMESALWKALTEARGAQTRHDQLVEQIEMANGDLEGAKARADRSGRALGELLRLAGLSTAEELEPLMAHIEQRAAIQSEIDSLRGTLGGLARGHSVDEFVNRVLEENSETLAERKAAAARGKAEKEPALAAIRETLYQLGASKRKLEEAGDAAAHYRQQAEICASSLKEDAARFLRLRLASHLLEIQIERFRKENQGPLLQKSGEVFSTITCGAFRGLAAEFNVDDVPVLMGLRPDGSKVAVEGLSDGSRDQLFLALRLAALDRHLEQHEPMPLILDDLLMTFDDNRAKAILPEFAALARRTQVFLFTHHEHLAELCRETLGEGGVHIHRLHGGN